MPHCDLFSYASSPREIAVPNFNWFKYCRHHYKRDEVPTFRKLFRTFLWQCEYALMVRRKTLLQKCDNSFWVNILPNPLIPAKIIASKLIGFHGAQCTVNTVFSEYRTFSYKPITSGCSSVKQEVQQGRQTSAVAMHLVADHIVSTYVIFCLLLT